MNDHLIATSTLILQNKSSFLKLVWITRAAFPCLSTAILISRGICAFKTRGELYWSFSFCSRSHRKRARAPLMPPAFLTQFAMVYQHTCNDIRTYANSNDFEPLSHRTSDTNCGPSKPFIRSVRLFIQTQRIAENSRAINESW